MKLIKKHGKKIALLLSVVLLATAVIGGTLAYVVTKTPSLLNTFITDHSGDLVISKAVDHPFGDNYAIPDDIEFDFTVSFGDSYKNETLTIQTSATESSTKTTDDSGSFGISIKPGQTIRIKDITVGTSVTVTENLDGKTGFTVKNEAVKSATINRGDNAIEFVNVYSPAPAPVLTIGGKKVLEGREWIDGDSFAFVLEKYIPDESGAGGTWVELSEASVVYEMILGTDEDGTPTITPPADGFNEFSFNALTEQDGTIIFDKAGVYSFRVSEAEGNIPGIAYDKTLYAFDVTVGDEDMDGALEIQDIDENSDNITVDSNNVGITFTNTYSAAGSDSVLIHITKVVESEAGAKSRAGYTFELYDEEGNLIDTSIQTSEAGETSIELNYTAEDAGKTFNYTLKETNAGQTIAGIKYDENVYGITVTVTDNLDGTISASIGETVSGASQQSSDGNKKKDESTTEPEGDAPEVDTTEDSTVDNTVDNTIDNTVDNTVDSTVDNTVDDIGSETGENTGGDSSENVGNDSGTGDEIPTIDNNAQQLSTGTAKTKSIRSLTSATENGDDSSDINEIDASQNEYSVAPDNQADDVYAVTFTNVYTPISARSENINGKKVLEGRELKADEFSFKMKSADNDSDFQNITVTNNAEGKFTFDLSEVTYDKIGTYNYVIEEIEDELGGVTYDTAKYTVTVTVTDDGNGALTAATSIADSYGKVDNGNVVFKNTYNAAKTAVTLTAKKELTGADITAGRFSFLLYEADESMNRLGDALEKVSNAANGAITFKELEFAEAGTYRYVVNEDTSANEAGMTYDSTAYGIMITVTDDGEGQLIAATAIVNLKGGPVEEMIFHNTYVKPEVTPTPSVPITPTPVPTPTPDDIEIPVAPDEDDSGVPPTGDDNPIGLYVTILLISAGAIAGLAVTGKTNKKSGKRRKRARAR